jgi:hypothetical protein
MRSRNLLAEDYYISPGKVTVLFRARNPREINIFWIQSY